MCSGILGLLLVKILLPKISVIEFESYNLILSVFSLLPILDLSYNGVRNYLTEASIRNDNGQIFSILIAAFKLNVLLAVLVFLLCKILLFTFGLNGFLIVILLQIVVINLKLITAYYQSINEHFMASFVDFSLSLVFFLFVLFSDKFINSEEFMIKYSSLHAVLLLIFWAFFLYKKRINKDDIRKFSVKKIAVKGFQYSVTQVVLLLIPVIVVFYFRNVQGQYFDYVLANRFYLVILTFQSILITPYWSMINTCWISKNYEGLRLIKKKFFRILFFTIGILIGLFFINEWLVLSFFDHTLISGINTRVFIITLLSSCIISFVIYFNSINRASEIQRFLLGLLMVTLPLFLFIFWLYQELLFTTLLSFQFVFLGFLVYKIFIVERELI